MKVRRIFTILCMGITTMLAQAQQDDGITVNQPDKTFLLVGSYVTSDKEGVKVYRFDEQTGDAEYVNGLKGISNPSFFTTSADGERIYAVGEEDGNSPIAYSIRFDKRKGLLEPLNFQSTEGGLPIYAALSPKEGFVLTANYMGGSITVFALDTEGRILPDKHLIPFTGNGPNKERQEKPHLHCVAFTPDGQYLLAADLGTDHIYMFPVVGQLVDGGARSLLDESRRVDMRMEPGSGPRHICFHPDGKFAYLISELSGKITVFSYQNGKLNILQTIVCDPFAADGSADIHVSPDGKFLYASKRLKEDGIVIYSIRPEKGTLTQIGYQSTGFYPRNFAISPNGRYLLVTCRDSNCVQIFERNQNTGLLKDTGKSIKLNKPSFVEFPK